MKLSAKFIRSQLAIMKPVVHDMSVELSRKGQNTVGKLMSRMAKSGASYEKVSVGELHGYMLTPKDEISSGIILYLHGGGYMCGGDEYAKGFSSILSSKMGIKVFAPVYSLAPEFPFPKAVDDSLSAYKYLLSL
jgi:acetyl esterase/lipase